jgi:acyl carrier protein
MESNAATLDDVRAILIETLGIADRADSLTADAALLGAVPELDSLAVVEVMTSIEERFGFQIDDDDFSGEIFETVGSLAKFVDQHRTR